MESALACQNVNYPLQLAIMSIVKKIGLRIKQARRMRVPEMSIEKLAEMSGMSRQTVSAVENGKQRKVSFDVIARLTHALGMTIDLDELMGSGSGGALVVAEPPPAEYGKKKSGKSPGKSASEMVSRRGLKRAG